MSVRSIATRALQPDRCRRLRAQSIFVALLMTSALCMSVDANAQVQIGIGGISSAMSPEEVTSILGAQGQRVISTNARYVEAILADADTKGAVRARFIFDATQGESHIKSVEFVEDDDKSTRQYLRWYSRLSAQYGPEVSREQVDLSTRDTFCHTKSVSIVLALFDQRAVLAYFFNEPVSGNCQRAVARREFDALAYDFRPPGTPSPVIAKSPAPSTAEKRAPAPATERSASAATERSPLAYAPNRSQRYQDKLRCIGVSYFNLSKSNGDPKARSTWDGLVRKLSNDLLGIGQAEGMAPAQINAEGRSIVGRNQGPYGQGQKDGSGRLYSEMDLGFCRSNGMIP